MRIGSGRISNICRVTRDQAAGMVDTWMNQSHWAALTMHMDQHSTLAACRPTVPLAAAVMVPSKFWKAFLIEVVWIQFGGCDIVQFPCWAACWRSHLGEATSPHPLERLMGSPLHRPHIAAEGLSGLGKRCQAACIFSGCRSLWSGSCPTMSRWQPNPQIQLVWRPSYLSKGGQ